MSSTLDPSRYPDWCQQIANHIASQPNLPLVMHFPDRKAADRFRFTWLGYTRAIAKHSIDPYSPLAIGVSKCTARIHPTSPHNEALGYDLEFWHVDSTPEARQGAAALAALQAQMVKPTAVPGPIPTPPPTKDTMETFLEGWLKDPNK